MAIISRKQTSSWQPSTYADLRSMLYKYKILKLFNRKLVNCEICNEVVSKDNIGSLFEDQKLGRLFLICNKPVCIKQYLNIRTEKLYD